MFHVLKFNYLFHPPSKNCEVLFFQYFNLITLIEAFSGQWAHRSIGLFFWRSFEISRNVVIYFNRVLL